MTAVKLRDNVYWVGATDWDVRSFHGYLTPRGSTYNAYLVLDEKITLIDTVKAPFYEEMLKNIREIIDPARIEVLISNHVEPDHSGALPRIAALCPEAKVYATANGIKGLRAYYRQELNFEAVGEGSTLQTGQYTFKFLPMPMVHWPDSMSVFLQEHGILFSNDALGQHYASVERFDDELPPSLLWERAGDYYANIVLPFGKQVNRLLQQVAELPIQMIAPSHGIIWRQYLPEIVSRYQAWANHETDEHKSVIIYDTMWGATRQMAVALAEEQKAAGIKPQLINLANTHVSTAISAVLDARHVAVGSPTLNRQVMPNVAAFLAYMRGLAPQKRLGLAFGAYGWSGESIKQIEDVMQQLGFELEPCRKVLWQT